MPGAMAVPGQYPGEARAMPVGGQSWAVPGQRHDIARARALPGHRQGQARAVTRQCQVMCNYNDGGLGTRGKGGLIAADGPLPVTSCWGSQLRVTGLNGKSQLPNGKLAPRVSSYYRYMSTSLHTIYMYTYIYMGRFHLRPGTTG